MDISRFCQSWAFSTNRPRFSDYPTLLDDSVRLPPLQASLEDIGEYQRRLWANRRQALLLVVHGTDTSGKDSLIRTLATYTDPAGFHAWSFSRRWARRSGTTSCGGWFRSCLGSGIWWRSTAVTMKR